MHNESKKCFKKVIFSLNKNLEIVIRKKKKISTNIIKLHQMWSEDSPEEEKNIFRLVLIQKSSYQWYKVLTYAIQYFNIINCVEVINIVFINGIDTHR